MSEGGVTLEILSLVTSSRLQNGLRHNSYQRYRHYCTRRVASIRKAEGVAKVLNVKGDKSSKAKGTPSASKGEGGASLVAPSSKTERALQLPLVNAERAWAYAMQCKQDSVNHDDEARKLNHSLRRLRKAAKWADELKRLATDIADDVTALEADAYASIMNAYVALEIEDFGTALSGFTRGSKIYENLSLVSSGSKREAYNSRVSEIKQHVRYCEYNMNKGSSALRDFRLEATSGGTESELLTSKLDAVLAAARRKEAASSDSSVSWRGITINIKSELVKFSLLTADERKKQLSADNVSSAAVDGAYTALFSAYDDSLAALGNDLKKLKANSGSASDIEQCVVLQAYIKECKLRAMLERNEGMSTKAGSTTSPIDSVRIYEIILDNLHELHSNSKIEVAPATVEETKCLALRAEAYRACRVYSIGATYQHNEEYAKACLVYDQAIKIAEDATSDINAMKKASNPDLISALTVADFASSKSRMGHAACVAKSFLSSSSTVDLPSATLPELPPQYATMAAKPTLFDLAYSEAAFPDWTKRVPSEKAASGWLTGWFS